MFFPFFLFREHDKIIIIFFNGNWKVCRGREKEIRKDVFIAKGREQESYRARNNTVLSLRLTDLETEGWARGLSCHFVFAFTGY